MEADIGAARGKAVLTETTAAGWGEDKTAAPQADWKPQRLGPNPPDALVAVADAAFSRMVAACGAGVSLFADADGTAQREAWRRWHLGTVQPLAKLLAHELTVRLETTVSLRLDKCPTDLAGRAGAFKASATGGMDVAKAAAVSGLMLDDE